MIGTCATNSKAINQEIVSRSRPIIWARNSLTITILFPKIGAYLESGLLMPMGMHGNAQDVEPWIIRHKAVKKIQKSVRCRLRRNILTRHTALKLHQKSALTIQCSYRCYRARVHLHSALLLAYFHMTAFIVQNATRKHHAKKELENKRNERSTNLSLVAEGYTKTTEGWLGLENVYHDDEDGSEDVEIQVLDIGEIDT